MRAARERRIGPGATAALCAAVLALAGAIAAADAPKPAAPGAPQAPAPLPPLKASDFPAATSKDSAYLERFLAEHPEADADHGGVLTAGEARAAGKTLKQPLAGLRASGGLGTPTHANVSYGPHKANVMDLWLAKSAAPTGLVIFIHGGGFRRGDKSHVWQVGPVLAALRAGGVSCASINYRMMGDGASVVESMRDCARAVQFLRANAAKYNLDPKRIAAAGVSAGAGTSVWLACHDDLADAAAVDAVLRQSTRLAAAVSIEGQCTYDLAQWPQLVGPPPGLDPVAAVRGADVLRNGGLDAARREADFLSMIDRADAPLLLVSLGSLGAAHTYMDYVHHPRHSLIVKQAADKAGLGCELVARGADRGLTMAEANDRATAFLLKHLAPPKN